MSVLATTLVRLDAATDGQLLGRFVQSRDADAFAALVRRLGPTVLAVCRRVCPDSHLAEDAFQAAFLVLATKAEAVKPREQVAVWLYGVAYRTASKARAMLSNRRRRETGSPALPEAPAPDAVVPDDDELRKLDTAIATLPENLRAAVVLCELEGRSRKDAAKQLGIPEGTLSSRLADARRRLGERLRPVAAVVTAVLAARTAEAALGGSTSETVQTLARGVMSMMLLHKLKLPAVLLGVALAATVFTVPLLLAPAPAAPVPKSLKPTAGTIGVTKGGKFYLLRPDGEVTDEFDLEERWNLQWLDGPCVVSPSPNGFPVAVLIPRGDEVKKQGQSPPRYELRLIRSADDRDGQVVAIGEEKLAGHLVWARSGRRFYVDRRATGGWDHGAYLVVDVAGGKATPAAVPEGHQLVGEAADGILVTETATGVTNDWPLHRVSADGKTVTPLEPCPHYAGGRNLSLAPDGRTVLSWRGDNRTPADTPFAFDTQTGETTDIVPKDLLASIPPGKKVLIQQARWSPDGKRVGFLYLVWKDQQDIPKADVVLHVCDRDGSNGKDVFTWSEKGDTMGEIWDAHFEWN